jgi:hypothetical protein
MSSPASNRNSGRPHIVYHLARADFLERARRYSFLLTLGFALYLGYAAATGKINIYLDNYRGIYTSAWVGTLMVMIINCFLTLAGFYIVKNSIERDRQTHVGQILAATPLRRITYVFGKAASNFAVLMSMVLILALSAVAMQLFHREDPHLDLWALLSPFLFLAPPAMAMVSALAVLFESIPWLSGGLGNVVYFFLWNFGFVAALQSKRGWMDWIGFYQIIQSLQVAARATIPGYKNDFQFGFEIAHPRILQSLHWGGVTWTPEFIAQRLLWFAAALLLTLLAALFFNRFDPSRAKAPREVRKPAPATADETKAAPLAASPIHLTPLAKTASSFCFGAVLTAELRLMLKGQKWWWYAVAAGLIIAGAAVPSADARGKLLAVAWIWPILLWSSMGVRESRDRTSQLLFSTPHPLVRQLPAVWLAGVIVALLTGSGFALRLLATGNIRGLAAWLIGALFIPSLALSLGVWSGSSKPFEVLYTILWYIGPLHSIPQFDFMASAPITRSTQYPSIYLLLSCALAFAALIGRKRQLQT